MGGLVRRPSNEAIVAAGCVVFLAWFLMKFHMDNSNDSETQAYVGGLLASTTNRTLAADANGHYAALAPFVMWPFATGLRFITGAYLIRGLVLALLFVGSLLNGAAYIWYRTVGLTWITSLFALVLLSTSVAFAMQVRGWELDKWIEPVLFLLAALAAWHQRWVAFVVISVLAAANRDTGIFAPFVGLVARSNRRWPIVLSLLGCGVVASVLWLLGPMPHISPFIDLNADRLVYVLGGVCLLPLLALAWARTLPSVGARWLLFGFTLAWLVFVLATDRLEQGAVLLAPLALLWVPLTLRALTPAAAGERAPAWSAPGT